MDRLTTIRSFTKVAELGSFRAAADVLNISRPMVSKHVLRLEDELGVSLLNRTTRSVALTEAGRNFLLRSAQILEDLDQAFAEASQQRTNPVGELRISAPVSFGHHHLCRALAKFQNLYGDIQVNLTLSDRYVDIIDEGFDLAIRIGELVDSSMIARRLAPCRLQLMASPEYLARSGKIKSPTDLKHHNCLIYSQFSQSKAWRFARDAETTAVSVSGNFISNSGEACVAAASAGLGIALEPEFFASQHLNDGRLIRLLPDWKPSELNIYAVYPANRLLPQKVRVLIDFLATSFEEWI